MFASLHDFDFQGQFVLPKSNKRPCEGKDRPAKKLKCEGEEDFDAIPHIDAEPRREPETDHFVKARKKVTAFFAARPDLVAFMLVPLQTRRDGRGFRVLNFFAGVMAKKNPVRYYLDEQGVRHSSPPSSKHLLVDVAESYNKMLRKYDKAFTAFFQKKHAIFLRQIKPERTDDDDEYAKLKTTVAQLNFCLWAWRYGVYDYFVEHLADIKVAHKEYNELQRRKTKT